MPWLCQPLSLSASQRKIDVQQSFLVSSHLRLPHKLRKSCATWADTPVQTAKLGFPSCSCALPWLLCWGLGEGHEEKGCSIFYTYSLPYFYYLVSPRFLSSSEVIRLQDAHQVRHLFQGPPVISEQPIEKQKHEKYPVNCCLPSPEPVFISR